MIYGVKEEYMDYESPIFEGVMSGGVADSYTQTVSPVAVSIPVWVFAAAVMYVVLVVGTIAISVTVTVI